MPNWCRNRLSISGNGPSLRRLIGTTQKCGSVKSIDGDEMTTVMGLTITNNQLAQHVDEDSIPLLVESIDVDDDTVAVVYITGWSPAFLDVLSKEYPDLEFYLEYYAPENDYSGSMSFTNGHREEITYESPIEPRTHRDWGFIEQCETEEGDGEDDDEAMEETCITA